MTIEQVKTTIKILSEIQRRQKKERKAEARRYMKGITRSKLSHFESKNKNLIKAANQLYDWSIESKGIMTYLDSELFIRKHELRAYYLVLAFLQNKRYKDVEKNCTKHSLYSVKSIAYRKILDHSQYIAFAKWIDNK